MITLSLILFTISLVFLFGSLVTLKKTLKEARIPLKAAIWGSIVGTVCHMIIISCHDYLISSICYSIFFAAIDVIVCAFFDFSRKFTHYRIKSRVFSYIVIIICVVDIISMLLNIPLEHAFSLKEIPFGNTFDISKFDSYIYKIDQKPIYQLHLILSYCALFLTFLCFILKWASVPKPYKFMYSTILGGLLIAVAGDALYVFIPVPVDFSILFISICAIVVSYFSSDFIPQRLVAKQLKNVVCYMNDAVKIFDYDGYEIYNNLAMQSLVNKVRDIGYNPSKIFDGLVPKNYAVSNDLLKDREFAYEIKTEGGSFSFIINVCYPKDDEGKPIGVFIIIHDRTKEVARITEERYRATHDTLTGLYNKETFFEKVRLEFGNHPDDQYIIVASDVDNFKLINDLFGKEVGDDFLIRIANAIKTYTKPDEIYARLERDRFVLLMKKEDYEESKFINLPSQVSYITENLSYPVNIHVGVYEIEDTTIPVSVMCDRAYMAINTIKGDFRKQVAYYDDNLRKKVLRNQQLIGDSSLALAGGEFEMYLQPQFSADNRIHGAEALARWNHHSEGLIHPEEFITLFEENGIISSLDQFMWEQAAMRIKKWQDKGNKDLYISVNISPRDFIYVDVYKIFTGLVEKYEIPPSRLNLEITESGILINFEKQLKLIEDLRAYGFRVEMDDFGSGYSSLNLLKDVPFDILKIDMEFLQETKNPERSVQILHSIVKLSKRLNMPVISEGVETTDQIELLDEIGVDYYQGYYFSKPIKVSEFEKKYLDL